MPGTETFADIIHIFANRSIHAYIGTAVKARQQWMMYQDMGLQQGWTTATDRKIRQWLVKLDRLRKRMIHTSGNQDQEIQDLEELAKALTLDLPTISVTTGLGDGIARPSGRPFELRDKFDGSANNNPNLSVMRARNIDGFKLITALDLHIVTATRLDARNATHRISPEEGMMLFAGLLEMWGICDECGGDEKIIGITEGVLPSEEPQGPVRSSGLKGGEDTVTRPQ